MGFINPKSLLQQLEMIARSTRDDVYRWICLIAPLVPGTDLQTLCSVTYVCSPLTFLWFSLYWSPQLHSIKQTTYKEEQFKNCFMVNSSLVTSDFRGFTMTDIVAASASRDVLPDGARAPRIKLQCPSLPICQGQLFFLTALLKVTDNIVNGWGHSGEYPQFFILLFPRLQSIK